MFVELVLATMSLLAQMSPSFLQFIHYVIKKEIFINPKKDITQIKNMANLSQSKIIVGLLQMSQLSAESQLVKALLLVREV